MVGLTEGVPYFFRARSADASGGDWGEWSTPVSATPYGSPGTVTAYAPATMAAGEQLGVTWSHDGAGTQRGWRVSLDGAIVASGSDAREAVTLDGIAEGAHEVAVSVTTGGDWARSDALSVVASVPPEGAASVATTLAAQPLAVTLSADAGALSAAITVTADGCAEDELHDAQPTGLVVWSGTFDGIAWAADGDGYAATATLPTGLDLRDGASYTVAVTLGDGSTGLSSACEPVGFEVAWAHQAAAPDGAVTVDAEARTATIVPTAPDGAAESDLCDVWRVTPDGAYQIAEGRAFGEPIVDRWAPFCEPLSDWQARYRVATRTADGDVDFSELPYELRSDRLRIDWGVGRSVELAYSLSGSDGWSKDFGAITHMDGTVGGSWSRATKRTAKLSGALVRVASADAQAALRELAQWAGPAFVRTSNGCAYMAHVTVSALAWNARTHLLSATISAQELTLGAAYMADPAGEE